MKDISTVCFPQDEVMALDAPLMSSPANRQHESTYGNNNCFTQHAPPSALPLHPSYHQRHLHHHHHHRQAAATAVVQPQQADVAGCFHSPQYQAPARCPPYVAGGSPLSPCSARKLRRGTPPTQPSVEMFASFRPPTSPNTATSYPGELRSASASSPSPSPSNFQKVVPPQSPPGRGCGSAHFRDEVRSSSYFEKHSAPFSPASFASSPSASSFPPSFSSSSSSPCASLAHSSSSLVVTSPSAASSSAASAALNLGKYAAVFKTENAYGQCQDSALSFLVPSPARPSSPSSPTALPLPRSASSPLALSTPAASPLSSTSTSSSTSTTHQLGTMVVKTERPSSPFGEPSPSFSSYHHHHHPFPSPSSASTSPSAGVGGCASASTAFPSSSSSSSLYFTPGRSDKPPSTLMSTLQSTPSPPPPSSNLPPLAGHSSGSSSSTLPSPTSSSSVGLMRVRKKEHSEESPGVSGFVAVTSNTALPPCRICLDKASGFHYGLNTCEACKGFFRRSLKRGSSYLCTRDGKCDVTGERRNSCGYCRYQKCIKLGMSRTAIKTGRYTHAKRTQDTLEIKKLMEPTTADEDKDIDLDGTIAHIIYWHDKHVICSTKKPKSFIEEQLQKKMDEMRLQKDLFGETSVSSDQHQEFLALTGMHIDNRETLMNVHVSNSDRWIRGYIEFAKQVPGFRNLTLGDQARLIKYARIEFWFLGSFSGYHSDLNLAVMPNGRCFTRKEMYTVWQEKYIDVSFDLSLTLKKLKVTPDEMIIIKTICLTAGDRCKFDEPENVAKLQWRLIRCLEHLMQKRITSRAEYVSTFSQVFTCLTDLRNLNEAEYQTIQNSQLYEKFSKNDLIMEVMPY